MRYTIQWLIACLFTIPAYANALVITDIISVNRNASPGVILDFDLRRGGYNPVTDSITFVKLSFSVREIVEFDDFEDDTTLESGMESYALFERRSHFRDIDTGTYSRQTSWLRMDECQIDEFEGPCIYNLDLFGNTAAYFSFYTDNLWFEEGRLEVEVDRISVPEPATLWLLCVGVLGIGAGSLRRLRQACS